MEKEAVFKRVFKEKPELEKVVKKWGKALIPTYLHSLYKTPSPSRFPKDRKDKLLFVFEALVRERFDQSHATEARKRLEESYVVSTADHHGPLCHPFFSHMFLGQAGVASIAQNPTIIILPCASISMTNSSFPRGIFFHDQTLSLQRIPLIPLKYNHHSVLHAPAYSKKAIEKASRRIEHFSLSKKSKEKLQDLLTNIYGDEKVLSRQSYDEQITLSNHALIKRIPGLEGLNLYYIPQEILASRLLIDLLETDAFFKELFSRKETRSLLASRFDTVSGAHNTGRGRGTFFFWGVREGNRIQLFEKNGSLVTEKGESYMALTNASVVEGLLANRLIPNMATTFIVLSFYHGLMCGGGFSQINYLGEMKEAYRKFLKDTGNEEESHLLESLPTNLFLGEIVGVTTGEGEGAKAATLIDSILHDETEAASYLSRLTLGEGIMRMMPEYYKIITGRYPEKNYIDHVKPAFTIK